MIRAYCNRTDLPLRLLLSVVVALVLRGTYSFGQEQEVLRNADIVKMASAQLTSEIIVLKIDTSAARFDTSPDALAVLKAAGVPDVVIAAMIRGSAKAASESPVPAEVPRTPATTASAPTETDATVTIVIYRPGKYWGKALEPSVFLDEQKLLDMDNGRYLALKLPARRYVLRSNEQNSEIDQTWEAGKTYYVKMTIATGMMKGRGQMAMVTEKLALAEVRKLRPLGRDNIEGQFRDAVDLTPLK